MSNSKQDSGIFWDSFSFIFWIILNQVLIALSWPTYFSLLLWDCRLFILKLVHPPFTNFESLLHKVGYAKHSLQNILSSVNLTHGKTFVQLTENYWQRLKFVFAFYLGLVKASLVHCDVHVHVPLHHLTTTTSSAWVFNVLTKYFNIFTAFRTRYEYDEPHVMVNHVKLSPDSLTDIHRHVQLYCTHWDQWLHIVPKLFPLISKMATRARRLFNDKAIGRPSEAFTAILIFEIVCHPVEIQIKQYYINFLYFDVWNAIELIWARDELPGWRSYQDLTKILLHWN